MIQQVQHSEHLVVVVSEAFEEEQIVARAEQRVGHALDAACTGGGGGGSNPHSEGPAPFAATWRRGSRWPHRCRLRTPYADKVCQLRHPPYFKKVGLNYYYLPFCWGGPFKLFALCAVQCFCGSRQVYKRLIDPPLSA